MDDISPFLRQEAGNDIVGRRWLRYSLALLVALVSVGAWWVARAAESSASATLDRTEVEYELSIVQGQLQQSDQRLRQIESILEQEGADSERARALIDGSATSFSYLAVVQPDAADEIRLAFDANETVALGQNSAGVISEVAETSVATSRAQYVAVPDDPAMIVVGRPLGLEATANNAQLPFADEIEPNTEAVLVGLLRLGSGQSSVSERFSYEVDGNVLPNSVAADADSNLYEATEFTVGTTQWVVTPTSALSRANHVASNLLWATGVALTTLVFFYRSRGLGESDEAHDRLLHRYYRLTDPVTGFFNEEGVSTELEIRLDRRKRSGHVGVLLCRIDRLDSIRHSLGRSTADHVIKTIFTEIHSQLEGSDSCGRLGDSKVLIMSNDVPTNADLVRIAERLQRRFEQPLEFVDGIMCYVSLSIGIASTQSTDSSAAGLLADVELAADRAAQRGGGAVEVFNEEKRQEAAVGALLQRELVEAVKGNGLAVHYQGLFDIDDAFEHAPVSKVEAFVRWPHSLRGMVHPQVFLPLATDAGVDLEIAKFVLQESCQQAFRWTEEVGRPITISVNIGERQLLDLRLVRLVEQTLESAGLPPGQLEIDVTEDLLLRKRSGAKDVLDELALMGVGISLDDFGASSGSLQGLRSTVNISTVKIDRSFVAHIATNEVNQKVVGAVVSMAQQCGIDVIAEGVETPAQLAALRKLKVGQAQGFLFHRPGPADGVLEVLRAHESID